LECDEATLVLELEVDGSKRRVLEESKYHGASERLGKTLRTKSTRTNTSSGTE